MLIPWFNSKRKVIIFSLKFLTVFLLQNLLSIILFCLGLLNNPECLTNYILKVFVSLKGMYDLFNLSFIKGVFKDWKNIAKGKCHEMNY